MQQLKDVQNQVDNFLIEKCKGAFIRSRRKWLEEGEKSTRYFLQLEKRNGIKKEIDCIEKSGKKFVKQEKILFEIYNYYKDLYSTKGNTEKEEYIDNFVRNVQLTTLKENEALSCEGDLTENECAEALSSMHYNKAPGSDSLSVEFYKCFWSEVKYLIIDCLNYGYGKQCLSPKSKASCFNIVV